MQIPAPILSLSRVVVAAAVLSLAVNTVSQAVQTNNLPNSALVSYNLAAGASTADYTLASGGAATHIMGTSSTQAGILNTLGVAEMVVVNLYRTTEPPGNAFFWNGRNADGTAALGNGSNPGTKMLALDGANQVLIEVSGIAGTQLHIRNTSGVNRRGSMTWMW